MYAVWAAESKYIIVDISRGSEAACYPKSTIDNVPSDGWTDEYKTTKLVLRKIPSGSFVMNDSYNITHSKAFYIGVFEITQKQYELVMGTRPSSYVGDNRPVEHVTYDMIRGSVMGAEWPQSTNVDSDSFMGKIRVKTKLNFDLPTEAQWEYSCRAGTTTHYNSGKNYVNSAEDSSMNEVGRYTYNQKDGKGGYNAYHTTVGMYQPNGWGLYDMHGNVWEWCLDWYGDLTSDMTDPQGLISGESRVLRGGGWYAEASSCTSAKRNSHASSYAGISLGFRIACTSCDLTIVKIQFDANGGSVMPLYDIFTVDKEYGALPIPIRSGYTFNGWYTAASGGTKVTASTAVSPSITTLYAQWKISAYTVSFNANGGTGSMTAKSVTIGSSVTLPKCTFTKSGYVFAGWATSSNGSVAYGDCVSITPTANVVLYAQWISNAKYMVIDLSGGTSASKYPVSYLNDVPSGGWTETYKTTKLVMRRIESGTFMMGSPTSELGRYTYWNDMVEKRHQVTISKPFYIGVFEVTQRQYELVIGVRPSYYNNNNYYKPRPVENVSRANVRGDDSVYNWPSSSSVGSTSFLGKLRSKTGILSFDLPTEAQWEYACRAGTTTSLNSGKNIASIDSYDANLMQVARCSWNCYNASAGGYEPSATSASGTAVVGSYLPNTWGLYDMHGNVEEMCLDWSGNYPDVSVVDPVGPSSGSDRASRGGHYLTDNRSCRSASRGGSGVGGADYVGFRISCLK